MATIKDVARSAQVSTATVSAVVNGSAYVSPALKARVEAAVAALDYAPSQAARSLKRGASGLVAVVVADLANPFYARLVCAAEAALGARGRSLVLFNSDESPENERRILDRVAALSCDGVLLVPTDAPSHYVRSGLARGRPVVLLGRSLDEVAVDAVTLDNRRAAAEVTNYLADLGHVRIGAIVGPEHASTGRDRRLGMAEALAARGLSLRPEHVRGGEFREEVAYAQAKEMLARPDRPTALYVANGVMALGVLRAMADLGLRCPDDLSVASTDTIPGSTVLRPRLTRTEHPVAEMVNEAVRLLADRIRRRAGGDPRRVVFQPRLVLGDSCGPMRSPALSIAQASAVRPQV
jgi:LacI family transcriptional regulator